MTVKKSLLSVKNLCFRRDDTDILHAICLDINEGEVLQIEGVNGSGKTTLLRLLTSALSPSEGSIHFCGKPLTDCRFDYLSSILFLGHQSAVKMGLTAEENLAWMSGLMEHSHSIACALEAFDLKGYSDIPCHRLSAGQQRRVALARLMLSNVKIWYLDEPFAALDTQGCTLVEQCMQRHINGGGAVVLSTHQSVALESLRRYSLPALNQHELYR